MKAQENKQRQQVVLGALRLLLLLPLKETDRFSRQQINKCTTGGGLSVSDCLTQTDTKEEE